MGDVMIQEAVPKETETPVAEEEHTEVPAELSAEVDGAIDDVLEAKAKVKEPGAEEEVIVDEKEEVIVDEETILPSKEGEEDKDKVAKDTESEQSGEITDEQLERAVQAGVSIAVARTIKDAKALDDVIALVAPKKEGSENVEELAETDLFAAIPELDPEEYDEKIVKAVEVLKEIITAQQGAIKGFQAQSVTQRGDWFQSQVTGLGEDVATVLKDKPEMLVELKTKFDIFEAGHKAGGGEVDRGAVFKEAVAVVLSDVQGDVWKAAKTAKLAKRSTQRTSRPDGAAGRKEKKSVSEEIADEIDEAHFKK